MSNSISSLGMKLRSRKGQGTVEYALTTLGIVVIIGFVLLQNDNPLRRAIDGAFGKAETAIENTNVGG